MNFHQLKYAVVVAESGSFREAARRLFMAQSSLSQAIKDLEDVYQIQIFERTKRGVLITDSGSEFLSYARDILSQVDVLENRYLSNDNKPLFSISGQHYDFVSEAFAQLVAADVTQAHDYRLLETSTNQVMEDVKNAYSEIGVLYFNDYNKKVLTQYLNRYDLSFHSLGKFATHIFIGKDHPLADYEEVTLDDLAPYPAISFEQEQGSSQQLTEETYIMPDAAHSLIYVSDRATSINVLMHTQAYLVGTGILTSPFRAVMKTVPLKQAEQGELGYIKSQYRQLSPIAEKFIAQLKATVPSVDSRQK